MPLIESASKEARAKNIAELIKSFKRKRTIGRSKPKSMAKARKQAIAIAFDNQRRNQ